MGFLDRAAGSLGTHLFGFLLLGLIYACNSAPNAPGSGKQLCHGADDCQTGYVCVLNVCQWKDSLPSYPPAERNQREPDTVPETPQEPSSDRSDAAFQEPREPVAEVVCPDGGTACKPCLSRDECPEGMLCKNRRCVACVEDRDCGNPLEQCVQQRCVRKGCASNAECKGGKVCVSNQCVVCKQDQQCDQGKLCFSGLCLKADCRTRRDCAKGLVCQQSQCKPCTQKTDCEAGEVCALGSCIQGNCLQNSDCASDRVCLFNQCKPCTNSAQCASGRVCVNGGCLAGDCVSSSDCLGGKVCSKNQCVACSVSVPCGSGKVCLKGVCSTGNCIKTDDCSGGQVCVSNQCTPCTNSLQCGNGEVCDKGSCKAGNCTKNQDCKAGELCTRNQCAPCKADRDCDSRLFQRCLFGRCSTPAVLVAGVYRWADGTAAKDCAGYRYAPPGYLRSTADGVYLLKNANGGTYTTYCQMTHAGGGWTLAMKVDGSKTTFRYKSSQWTSKTTLNPTSAKLDSTEAKFLSYSQTLVKEILLMFVTRGGTPRFLTARISGTSLYDLFRDGKQKSFVVPPGRLAWKSILPNGSLQYHCNREGLNVSSSVPKSGTIFNLRIGILANNEQDCTTPDSFIGVGSNETQNVVNSGNYCAVYPDAGNQNNASFVYVFVRHLSSRLGTKETNGARSRADGKYEVSCLGYRMPPVASTKDGMYWIQPRGATSPFKAYCDMTTDGGGWTLVLKADGRKTTFSYDKAVWTDGKTFQENNVFLDSNEGKLRGFLSLPVKHLLLQLQTPPVTGATRAVVIAKKAPSAQSLFLSGYSPFEYNLGRSTWKQLMGSSGSLQRYCNREGFNNKTDKDHAWTRIGIVSNDANNCSYTDSRIGIGSSGKECKQDKNLSVGNAAKCRPDNGDRNTKSFGNLFVR